MKVLSRRAPASNGHWHKGDGLGGTASEYYTTGIPELKPG